MIALSQDRTKTLLAVHGWTGVALGLLLYIVILTGAVAVFADEIGDWSSPVPHDSDFALPTGVDAALRELASTVDPEYLHDLFLFPDAGERIRVFFHHHTTREGHPAEEGVEFDLHPQTLAVMDRREGFADEIADRNIANALARFLVEIHVSLHIPSPWGLFVTGVLGLAMMVAAVTGFLTHRHLLREIFTIRRMREALLARRDAHVIAASWNLPFAFVLAFTGSFFSFAGAVGIPIMAMVAFQGDQEAMIETVVGTPPPEDNRQVAPANLDKILEDAREQSDGDIRFVAIEHYGRADSRVTTFAFPPKGELTAVNLLYDGATGEFLQRKPGLGLVPSIGSALADLMGPLHFGNFAGVLSKSIWFALGFAGCYVTLTGMLLWTTRRSESPDWQRMARAVTWVGYGLPVALLSTGWAYFIGRASGMNGLEWPMALALFGVAGLTALLAMAISDCEKLRRCLLGVTALGLVTLPILRLWLDGMGWGTALESGIAVVPVLDIAFIAGGLLCGWACTRPVAVVDTVLPVVSSA